MTAVMSETKSVRINGEIVQVPVTAWLGMKSGKIVMWFPTASQGDFAMRRRKIDSAMPASHYDSSKIVCADESPDYPGLTCAFYAAHVEHSAPGVHYAQGHTWPVQPEAYDVQCCGTWTEVPVSGDSKPCPGCGSVFTQTQASPAN